MKKIKTFSQLFENGVQLKPSHYWLFITYIKETRKIARFLVSGDSTRSITTKFLETILPEYLGFDSLYTISPDISPPEIYGYNEFDSWFYLNGDKIARGAGINDIYIHEREIPNGKKFSDFIYAFDDEDYKDTYTEISGSANSIAWLILNYIKYANGNTKNIGEVLSNIFDIFDNKIGNTLKIKNDDLIIWEKYPDILRSLFDSDESAPMYNYFKENPLELYMVKDPELKEKIRRKAGIEDYSKIGGLLKNGLL